jgi:3'-phosphoadenosine 5'-phosphosulfate sulfotransferase (PAPS reductase)/FAD synthetase
MDKKLWLEEFNKNNRGKILLMLSGGKDSSACLSILKKLELDVTAVHFKHRWGYALSSSEARRVCDMLEVPLIEIDFSEEFSTAIVDYCGGRPCLLCKSEMYKIIIDLLKHEEYKWLCIGDNLNDRTTINRIERHIRDREDEHLFCNSYFGSELGVCLPANVKVIRPVLDLSSVNVENYLSENGIEIMKNYSTGDKYFEYSREGCPVQFHDPGTPISIETMDLLKRYDTCITMFAKEKNIKASVHYPSTLIVTIPKGYEMEAGRYLEDNGLFVDWDKNNIGLLELFSMRIVILNLLKEVFVSNIQKKLYERFIERLDIVSDFKLVCEDHEFIKVEYTMDEGSIKFDYCNESNELSIEYKGQKEVDINLVMNLIIEIFRTRSYTIYIGA